MRRGIGIALGGGSSKGMAHIGVLEVLEENGIELSYIAGTSIGAIVGAAYAAEPDARKLRSKAKILLTSDAFAAIGFEFFIEKEPERPRLMRRITDFVKKKYILGRTAVRPFLVGGDKMQSVLENILPEIDISQLRIPFACVALDLTTGRDVVLKSGPLIEAVRASTCIPGVFPGVDVNGVFLVDGGSTASVPVDAAIELGAGFVIGVDLLGQLSRDFNHSSGLDINFRVDEIAKRRLNELRAGNADILIKPRVDSVHWADYGKLDFCIERGREAALEVLPLLRQKLRKGKIRRWWPFQYVLDRRNPK